MYELFIKNQKADLPSNFSILWTFNSTDLSSPSVVKNSFSKQIELPGSPKNNVIFNSLYKLEASYNIQFNPNIRNEFVLLYNGIIIESGYVQLNKISKIKNEVKYSITLFGGLGDFFYNLDKNEDGEKKTLYNLHWRWIDSIKTTTLWYDDSPVHQVHKILSYDQENNNYIMGVNPKTIALGWHELANTLQTVEQDGKIYTNVRNDIVFMPFDTGKPDMDNFEANKILIDHQISDKRILNEWWRDPLADNSNPVSFGKSFPLGNWFPKYVVYQGNVIAECILAETQRDISQLEAGSLISTQMVPGIRIGKLIDAIKDPDNNGGYEVELSEQAASNEIIKNGYICLDRINQEDLYEPLMMSEEITSNLYIDHNSSMVSDTGELLLPLVSDTIQSSVLKVTGSIIHKTSKKINSTAKLLLGGFCGDPIENVEWDWRYQVGNQWVKNIHRLVTDAYILIPSANPEPLPQSPTWKEYHFLGQKLNRWQLEWRNFRAHYEYSQMTYWPTSDTYVQFDKNYNNDKLFSNIVSFSFPGTNFGMNDGCKATVYLNYLKLCDQYNQKQIVYVTPYILTSEDIDNAGNYEYINKVPAQIYNWVQSYEFRYQISQYIQNKLNQSGKTIIAIHINWDNIIVVSANNYVNNFSTSNQKYIGNAYWSAVTQDIDNFTTPATLLYTEEASVNIINEFSVNPSYDLIDSQIDQLGDIVEFRSEYSWCRAEMPPMSYGATIVTDPDMKYATNFFWWTRTFANAYQGSGLTNISHPGVTHNDSDKLMNVANDGADFNKQWTTLTTTDKSLGSAQSITEIGNSYVNKSSILANTNSPYEYFISLSKLLNWKYEYDSIQKKIKIITADEYYNYRNVKALTIDYANSIDVTPYLKDASDITLMLEPLESYGNYLYNKQNGQQFGSVSFDNNYQFNMKQYNILENVIFKAGSEYVPSSPVFDPNLPFPGISLLGGTKIYRFMSPLPDGDFTKVDTLAKIPFINLNQSYSYDFPMLSCYDSDYKYVSPKNTIVLFNGFVSNTKKPEHYTSDDCLTYNQQKIAPIVPNYFGITAPYNEMNKLNDGNPCYVWNYWYNVPGQPNPHPETWAIYNTLTVWPTDIPIFSLYKWLEKDNSWSQSVSTTLLQNTNSYYPINPSTKLTYRIKSRITGARGSDGGLWWPMEQFPLWVTLDYSTHFTDALNPYTNNYLNGYAGSAQNMNNYKKEIANITDPNARQVKLKARLNTSPKIALKNVYNLNGGQYIISKIENYDVSESNPFCDVTLQKIKPDV